MERFRYETREGKRTERRGTKEVKGSEGMGSERMDTENKGVDERS